MMTLSGCVLVGAVAAKTIPPPPVPAEFIPAPVPLLVIAENKSADTMTMLDGDRINRLVTNEFEEYLIAPTINPDELVAMRDRMLSKFDEQSIQSIGRQLGAKQVLYVDVSGVGVGTASGSDIVRGQASAQVKLIDVESGRVIYPEDSIGGRQVSFQSQPARIKSGMSPASVRGEALEGLAHNIVKLFRNWQAEEEQTDLMIDD